MSDRRDRATENTPAGSDAQLNAILAELKDKAAPGETAAPLDKAENPPTLEARPDLSPQEEPPMPEEPYKGALEEPVYDEGEDMAPKKKRKSSVVLNILLVVCIIGVVVSIIGLVYTYMQYKIASDEYTDLRQYAQQENGRRVIDLDALRAINPDTIGWIEIPGTDIDYPLLQTTDNDFYLQYTFYRTGNPSGAIYMDRECEADFSMVNSIIYGHHMKDDSMFAGLAKYIEDPSYFSGHKEILIYTDEGIRHYEAIAAKKVNIHDEEMRIWFEDKETQERWLDLMGAGKGDSVITLNTCVNATDSTDERYVLQGVLKEIEPAGKAA